MLLEVCFIFQLLLGIKDTSDVLVSMTLYCLADLVPILGASAVIGGKRSKLFADGRPLAHPTPKTQPTIHKPKETRHLPKIAENSTDDLAELKSVPGEILLKKNMIPRYQQVFGSGESLEMENVLFLHERPSPDGGEDLDSEVVLSKVGDNLDSEEHWSDWENEDNINLTNEDFPSEIQDDTLIDDLTVKIEAEKLVLSEKKLDSMTISGGRADSHYLQKASLEAKAKKLADISELDIKNQKFKSKSSASGKKDEFDFFLDMEPVIEKQNVFEIQQPLTESLEVKSSSDASDLISQKLTFAPAENEDGKTDNDAWGDGDWED